MAESLLALQSFIKATPDVLERIIPGLQIQRVDVFVNEIKSGMQKAEKWMIDYIKSQSIEVGDDIEKIRKVATISANNDPAVGDLVVEGMRKVGIDGLITVDTVAFKVIGNIRK